MLAGALSAHLTPEPLTLTDRLAKVLASSDADLAATETLKLRVDRHASLSTLLAEYDVLAREAQADRWATLLDIVPFPENVADDVFSSPYYERLEAALARHEAAGPVAAVALTALSPTLTPGEEQTDRASQLATMLDQATSELPPGKNRRPRVAGLIATPAEPIAADIQAALGDRQALIETAARQLARDAQEARAAWVVHLGKPPTQLRWRDEWLAHAATIALYRHRQDITGPTPLGDPKGVKSAEQAMEYRVAQAALRSTQALSASADGTPPRRDTRRVGQIWRL